MATDSENSFLKDMNGNALREGDFVMILLDKPILVGFVTEIREPSVITSRDKNPPGIITITGTVRLPYQGNVLQVFRQVAKLLDPRSEGLVQALLNHAKSGAADIKLPSSADLDAVADEKEAADKTSGPTLVPTVEKES